LSLYAKKKEFTLEELKEQWKLELENAKLDNVDALADEDLEAFLGPQLSPVCAIIGSIIGQEAIKSISQNDPPLKNLFLYSALDTTGIVCELPIQGS